MVQRGAEVQLYSSFNFGAKWGVGGQRHAPAALPPGNRPGKHCKGAGWAPGPIWTGAHHLSTSNLTLS